jgi:hypothetical protein
MTFPFHIKADGAVDYNSLMAVAQFSFEYRSWLYNRSFFRELSIAKSFKSKRYIMSRIRKIVVLLK